MSSIVGSVIAGYGGLAIVAEVVVGLKKYLEIESMCTSKERLTDPSLVILFTQEEIANCKRIAKETAWQIIKAESLNPVIFGAICLIAGGILLSCGKSKKNKLPTHITQSILNSSSNSAAASTSNSGQPSRRKRLADRLKDNASKDSGGGTNDGTSITLSSVSSSASPFASYDYEAEWAKHKTDKRYKAN